MKIKNHWALYQDRRFCNGVYILFFVYTIALFTFFISPVKVFAGGSIYAKYSNFHGIMLPKTNITINGNNIPLRPLIIGLAHKFHINYALNNVVKGSITLHITKVPLNRALKIIFAAGNLSFSVTNGVLFIGTSSTLAHNYNTYKIKLKNIQAKTVLTVLTPILPKGGKAFASPHGNSILVYDLTSNIKKIKDIIKGLDVKKRVVLLNAKIVDVSDSFNRNIGIAWTFSPNVNNTLTSVTDFTGLTNLQPGQNYLNLGVLAPWQNFGDISAQLSLGQRLGWDKVVDSPSVAVISGQPATINSSVLMYYVAYTAAGGGTTTTQSPSGTGGTTVIAQEPVTSTLQTITIGITLTVTPIVESKNNILLNVTLTYSSPSNALGINGFPAVDNKSVTTTVSVKNNSTLVIGGILSMEKNHNNNGIPILSQIPVLGYLFSSHQRSVSKEQLMVFISPKIIN
jgi:type IV pilus assembly protein PilQ